MTSSNYGSVPQVTTEGSESSISLSAPDRAAKLANVAVALLVSCLVIYGGQHLFSTWDVLTVATVFVYLHAAFELLSGVMFVADPGSLHNGWATDAGMSTYLAESGGIAYFFWGLLLILKVSDPTVLTLNGLFCAAWFLYLGSILMDKPWRTKSAVPDGSWAMVPVVVKGVCGIASFAAAAELRG